MTSSISEVKEKKLLTDPVFGSISQTPELRTSQMKRFVPNGLPKGAKAAPSGQPKPEAKGGTRLASIGLGPAKRSLLIFATFPLQNSGKICCRSN